MATSLLNGVIMSGIFLLMFLVVSSYTSASSSIDPFKCINTTESIRHVAPQNGTLRMVVPWRVGFEQFVQFKADSCVLDGFSIQLFLQAVRRMGRDAPRFEFVLYGDGTETPPYNEMVKLTANGTVDGVVADLTINNERMNSVDFTVPYLSSTMVMVTPFRYGSAGTFWDFLKPFSRQLWLTLVASFVATGIALYLLEDQNPDFHMTSKPESMHMKKHPIQMSNGSDQPPSHNAKLPTENGVVLSPSDTSPLQHQGSPIYDEASHKRRILNAYWFTSLCVFAAQQESVRTHLGRFVTVIWLFVMLIFNSSYTASMASLLSAQKSYPTIKDFEALLKDERIKVGYQEGSFMKQYIMENLHIDKSRLIDCKSEQNFAENLRNGVKAHGIEVGAVLDELPYIKILLQYDCDFIKNTNVLELPSFGGLGFAFANGSLWIDRFSKIILEMAQDGTLEVLKNGWGIGEKWSMGVCSSEEPSHLRLRNFGGLFSFLGLVYIISITWQLLTRTTHIEQGIINSCSAPITNALCKMCGTQDGSNIQQGEEMARIGSLGRRSNRARDETTILE